MTSACSSTIRISRGIELTNNAPDSTVRATTQFGDHVEIRGRTAYEQINDTTCRCVPRGDLVVGTLPGVPRLVAGRVVKEVEKFVIKLLTPNLTSVNRGIERYLAANNGGAVAVDVEHRRI